MSAGAGGVKILLAGGVQGKIDALFKRVATVNASNGPFDLLLCTGSFFNAAGAPTILTAQIRTFGGRSSASGDCVFAFCAGSDEAEYVGELAPYLSGEKTAPVPTYFIGGSGLGSKQALSALAATPQCDIHYLGRTGVISLKGLQIAFLDGTYNAAAFRSQDTPEGPGCRYYRAADVDALRQATAQAEGDIDLFLTNDWPAGILTGLADAATTDTLRAIEGEV